MNAPQPGGPGPEMFSLAGRTAVVTGARSGMGQAMAIGMARAGADLVLIDINSDMAETAEAARAAGAKVEQVAVDLSQPDAVDAVCADLNSRYSVDILVNNAGVISRAPATEVPYAHWRKVLAVNLEIPLEGLDGHFAGVPGSHERNGGFGAASDAEVGTGVAFVWQVGEG